MIVLAKQLKWADYFKFCFLIPYYKFSNQKLEGSHAGRWLREVVSLQILQTFYTKLKYSEESKHTITLVFFYSTKHISRFLDSCHHAGQLTYTETIDWDWYNMVAL